MVVARLASPADRPRMVRLILAAKAQILVGAGFGIGLTMRLLLVANSPVSSGGPRWDRSNPVSHSAYWRHDNENPALAGFLKLLRERYASPST